MLCFASRQPSLGTGQKQPLTSHLVADCTDWEKDNARFEEQFERMMRASSGGLRGERERPDNGSGLFTVPLTQTPENNRRSTRH
jgi:hypothetical protein